MRLDFSYRRVGAGVHADTFGVAFAGPASAVAHRLTECQTPEPAMDGLAPRR